LLAPVIRRDASDEQVDAAAKKVVEQIEKDEAVRKEIGRIATTIVESGKLANYGTARAQEHLKKWAKEYGSKPAPKQQADGK
jgi:hypothetical protein